MRLEPLLQHCQHPYEHPVVPGVVRAVKVEKPVYEVNAHHVAAAQVGQVPEYEFPQFTRLLQPQTKGSPKPCFFLWMISSGRKPCMARL